MREIILWVLLSLLSFALPVSIHAVDIHVMHFPQDTLSGENSTGITPSDDVVIPPILPTSVPSVGTPVGAVSVGNSGAAVYNLKIGVTGMTAVVSRPM
jgi:hypothetical protein